MSPSPASVPRPTVASGLLGGAFVATDDSLARPADAVPDLLGGGA